MPVGQRTRLKNRIHANLAKYGATSREATDLFGARGRIVLGERIRELPYPAEAGTASGPGLDREVEPKGQA